MVGSGLAGILLCVLAIAASSGCRSDDEAGDATEAASYKDVVVERGTLRIAVNATGVVRPIDRIELKSKASGKVIELPIEVGDPVAKGALIARLDQVDERSALAQARADLDVARAERSLARKRFERRQELLGSDVISKEDNDQVELELAVAEGRLVQATTAFERAQERLTDTIVTSPVDGIVLQRYVAEGQIIASGVSNVGGGTPIADVADMRTVQVEAGIDEIDIDKIAVGAPATIRPEALPDRSFQGRVVRIAPEARIEQNVTLFDVVIEVENRDGKLRSGMNAGVELVISQDEGVLLIPLAARQPALSEDGAARDDGAAMVLVEQDGHYEPRSIRTGRKDRRRVEVLEGLREGETVAIPMRSRLKDEIDQMNARFRGARGFGARAH
jgi:HlyD family secretion protein